LGYAAISEGTELADLGIHSDLGYAPEGLLFSADGQSALLAGGSLFASQMWLSGRSLVPTTVRVGSVDYTYARLATGKGGPDGEYAESIGGIALSQVGDVLLLLHGLAGDVSVGHVRFDAGTGSISGDVTLQELPKYARIAGACDLIEVNSGGKTWLHVLPEGAGYLQLLDVSPELARGEIGPTLDLARLDARLAGLQAIEATQDGRTVFLLSRGGGANTGYLSRLRLNLSDNSMELAESLADNLPQIAGLTGAQGLQVASSAVFVAGTGMDAIVTFQSDSGAELRVENAGTRANGDVLPLDLPGLEAAVISPDGRHVYAVHAASNALVALDAQSGAVLRTYVGGAAGQTALLQPIDVAVSPAGGRVFVVAAGSNAIVTYNRLANGDLQFYQSSSFVPQTYGNLRALATPPVQPGTYPVYAITNTNLLALTQDASRLSVAKSLQVADPTAVVLAPDGNTGYITSGNGQLYQFRYDAATGTLTRSAIDTNGLISGARGLAVNPAGDWVYAVGDGVLAAVHVTAGGTTVHRLVEGQDGIRGLAGATAVAVSPDGPYVFVTSSGDDSLSVFRRDEVSGVLRLVQGIENGFSPTLGLVGPNSISVAPLPPGGRVFVGSSAGVGIHSGGLSWFDYGSSAMPARHAVEFSAVSGAGPAALTVRTGPGDDLVNVVRLYAPVPGQEGTIVETGNGGDRVEVLSDVPHGELVVRTEADSDAVHVWRTGSHAQTTLDTGDKGDTIYVSGPNLQSGVRVFGGPPTTAPGDQLTFEEGKFTAEINNRLGTIQLNIHMFVDVTYTGIEDVEVIDGPRLQVAGPAEIQEGDWLSLTATTDPAYPDSDLTFTWDLNADGLFGDGNKTGSSVSFSWDELRSLGINDDGVYDVAVRAAHAADPTLYYQASTQVTIAPAPPNVVLVGNSSVLVGDTYRLDLVPDHDHGDDTISQWEIQWGDGDVETMLGESGYVTHVYQMGGMAQIIVTATDEDGSYIFSKWIERKVPPPDAGGPYTIQEGQDLRLRGDVRGTPLHITWSFGSNAFAEGASPVVPWTELVTAGLTDDTGGASGDWITATFSNPHDPSPDDQAHGFRYAYDYTNDGRPDTDFTTASTVAFRAGRSGTQWVRGVIEDFDGGTTEYVAAVTVYDTPPTLELAGTATVAEGATYSLSLSAHDPGDDAVRQWRVDWGDGTSDTASTPAPALAHVFADDGQFTLRVTAMQDEGVFTASKPVTVTNVAPTLFLGGLPAVDEGAPYTLLLASSDPGNDRLVAWTIDWGDGVVSTVAGAARSAAHRYVDDSVGQAGGVYRITATAVDEDAPAGGPGYAVSRILPLARPVVPFDDGGGATGHYYLLTSQAGSRAAAYSEAAGLGGYLVSVGSQAEQDFVDRALMGGAAAGAWIGLTQIAPAPITHVTADLLASWDAARPGGDQKRWEPESGSEVAWDFRGANVPELQTGIVSRRALSTAFEFDNSTATSSRPFGGSAELVERGAAWEMWVRPHSLLGNEVLFEAGGSAEGLSLTREADQLVLRLRDPGGVSGERVVPANALEVRAALSAEDISD
ncbi:MAG: PKD domain-containing protein, partial [Pirellulaceae bacterium]|nr:PKD domain-containing protein [Pirellulaceae bacterium]